MPVPANDLPELHQKQWKHLADLVALRDQLLQDLAMRADLATGMSPSTGTIPQFDALRARELVDAAGVLTHKIHSQMQVVNELGARLGKPQIRWQNLVPRYQWRERD